MPYGETHDNAPAPLSEQIAVLRLRKWWVIGVAIATLGAALAFSFLQSEVFTADTHVVVRPVPIGNTGEVERPNMVTERELAGSTPVATIAAETLGMSVPTRSFIKALDVDVIEDTEILIFHYAAPTAREARDGSQAFATAYLSFRQQQALAESSAAILAIQEEIALQQAALKSVNKKIGAATNEVKRGSLLAQQAEIAASLGTLRNRLASLSVTDQARVGQVTIPAEFPRSPTSPKPIRNAILALIAGMALGVGVAFVIDRLDERIRGPEALESITGASTLSVVPNIPQTDRDAGLVTLTRSDGPFAEAYRTLRTGLLFASAGKGARVILVTSPAPGDGKTHTVANLGVAIAQTGKRVVLISADLRRPDLHRAFGIPLAPGLADLLLERKSVWEMLIRPEGTENLWVLPSGQPSGSPPDMLGSRSMLDLLRLVRDSADYVLIDVGPVLAVPDAIALAPHVDGILLVVAAERTPRGAVRQTVRQLEVVRAPLVGTVLNGFRPKRAAPYYYSEYYGYGVDHSASDDSAVEDRTIEDSGTGGS